jgi:hypothetical protein
MTGSISPSPLLFIIAILALLVWQVLGGIGPEYSLLYWIGRPWRNLHLSLEPITVEPEAALALMVWADDGGADEQGVGI